MFNYTCRFKAQCFATGRKSSELFRMYKYWLNQIETTRSKYNFITLHWPGSAPYASVHTGKTFYTVYSLFAQGYRKHAYTHKGGWNSS